MISYSLSCAEGHRFDAWFRSADAFDTQAAQGAVACPVCGSTAVTKALMAPAVATSRRAETISAASGQPDLAEVRRMLQALRRKVMAEADYVGDRFAEEARKIHFEEVDPRGIYGEATREEVAGLLEDGIDFLPLPGVPDEAN